MNAYLDGMRRFTDFKGTATRSQFWQFTLITFLIFLAAAVVDYAVSSPFNRSSLFVGLAILVHLIPSIAVSARRLHDAGISGWWYLLNYVPLGVFVFIFLACLPTTTDANRFAAPETAGSREPTFDNAAAQPVASLTPVAAHPQLAPQPASNLAAAASAGEVDIVARLERLAALRASGAIDDTEFALMKTSMLSKGVA